MPHALVPLHFIKAMECVFKIDATIRNALPIHACGVTFAANRKASSENWKASSENWKASSENWKVSSLNWKVSSKDAEGFF